MEKINIAEILKNCQKGMELDCTMFVNPVILEKVSIECKYPIAIKTIKGDIIELTEYGQYEYSEDAKCVIFPKGKTTWDGFVPPVKFKDGDIISNGKCICVYNGNENGKYYGLYVGVGHALSPDYFIEAPRDDYFKKEKAHIATKEEKQKLFQTIKNNGYKWNAETKILEKLIKPKFKVGDKIKNKTSLHCYTITEIKKDCYLVTNDRKNSYIIPFINEKYYELVTNKFNITTLKPFDKVLVRCNCSLGKDRWHINFFERYDNTNKFPFVCINGNRYNQCVPFKHNEYLLNTNNNCNEFYKIWNE
jgi:hypothetical protein